MQIGFRDRLSPFTETAHTDAVPDDDDRPRDASSAADPAWSDAAHAADGWSDTVVPDDISDLAGDIAAYHREQRAQRRREFILRHATSRGGRPVLLVLAALAVVAVFAAFLTVFSPTTSRPTPPATPSAAPGHQGGLLPSVSLQDLSGKQVPRSVLKPSVIALIPAGYGKVDLLGSLATAASSAKVRLVVVAPTPPNGSAIALDGQIDSGTTHVYYDLTGQLATGVKATGVTVVLVNRDGTIFRILRAVDAGPDGTSKVGPLAQQMLQGTGG
jgi:hypothetical protein